MNSRNTKFIQFFDTQTTQCKPLILLGKTEVIKHRATFKRHSVDNLTTTIEEKKEIKKYIFINKNIYIVQKKSEVSE